MHFYESVLLKESFSEWQHPITVIHDCIRMLPRDMDRALDKIRDGVSPFIFSRDSMSGLADDLSVSEEQLPSLHQLDSELNMVLKSGYMFN